MEIRKLRVDDATEFWRLRLEGLRESPEAFGAAYSEEVTLSSQAIVDKFNNAWSQGDNFILGAFMGTEMVGCAGFVREHREKLRHKGFVWGMYAAPHVRKQGIGTKLLEELVRQVKQIKDMEQVNLTVVKNNAPAMKLYLNHEFKAFGIEERALKVGNQYLDEIHMVLDI